MSSGLLSAASICALALLASAGHGLAGQADPLPASRDQTAMMGGAETLPPKYLSVPDFKTCLSMQSQGAYQSWCLPRRKPGVCPAESWASLKALKGADALPNCARVASRPH